MLVELSVVEQRYHAVIEVVLSDIPVIEVTERYGVSRKTVHARLRRYRQEGLPGLVYGRNRPHGFAARLQRRRRRASPRSPFEAPPSPGDRALTLRR
jgi:transposase